MPTQDTSKIKEKIINFLRTKGPSLPVHIAKEIGTDTLFASAFLSELISDRRIKTSHMKVGSSSLHYLKGQEQKLENFSKHLNTREKEAFELLKEEKFLKDSELQPVMRVAMRSIKDFAIPFKKNNEIYWRYFNVTESEFPEEQKKEQEQKQGQKDSNQKDNQEQQKQEEEQENTQEKGKEKQEKGDKEKEASEEKSKEKDQEAKKEETEKSESKETEKQEENKEEKDKKSKKSKKKKKKRKRKSKKRSKKKEKFFNKVKSFLETKSIEITGIEGFGKKYLVLKISKEGKEYALVAFDQKRIRENDIIKAHKKAKELNLPYFVLSRGTPLKKVDRLVKAVKKLAGIKKIE